jgi:hypothetical protein
VPANPCQVLPLALPLLLLLLQYLLLALGRVWLLFCLRVQSAVVL